MQPSLPIILDLFRNYSPLTIKPGASRQAAVLVGLLIEPTDNPRIILTRRSLDLSQHAGQVALPGGAIDEQDQSATDAALRETQEEINISPNHITILGQLDQTLTVTHFHVTPLIGIVAPNTPIKSNPKEVARVFTLPLALLFDTAQWQKRHHSHQGHEGWTWQLQHDGEEIWGVTASILRGMAEVIWQQ